MMRAPRLTGLRRPQPGPRAKPARRARGAFLPGFLAGLLTGLAVALAVALYVTRTPVPFVDKLPQRTAEQDAAEAAKNRNWDPNAAMPGKAVRPPATQASAPAQAGSAPAAGPGAAAAPGGAAPGRDPAAILAGAAVPALAASAPRTETKADAKSDAKSDAKGASGKADPAAAARPGDLFIVQAGAFQRAEEADAQRAKLSLLGLESRVVERPQAGGRIVFRVRLGPFEKAAEAETARERIAASGIEAVVLRAEKGAP
jgi:cell division protein FtsN